MDRTVLLLEGPLIWHWVIKESRVDVCARGVAGRGVEARPNKVLALSGWLARVWRGAAHTLHALGRLVVHADHLLVEQLISHSGQAVLLLLLLLHPCELGHVDETAVEDDLSLRIFRRSLELERLDLAFVTQCVQQVLRIVVDIAKNDPFVPLTVSQRQLLECDLVLFGLADGHRDAVLVGWLVDRQNWHGLPWR